MSGRWRKFLGGIGVLAFLALYTIAAVAIGERLPDHWAARLVYFAIVGTAWGVPLIPLLSWMHRADKAKAS